MTSMLRFVLFALLAGAGSPGPEPERDAETVIDIDVKDADVLDVLRLLAEVGELNLVADPDVSCELTLKLTSVPWPQVLELVLATCRLEQDRLGDNLVRVATAEQLRREYEERRRYRGGKGARWTARDDLSAAVSRTRERPRADSSRDSSRRGGPSSSMSAPTRSSLRTWRAD